MPLNVPAGAVFDGGKLRELRRARGLSLWKLSRRLDRRRVTISPDGLRQIEVIRGREPKATLLVALCAVLVYPPERFFSTKLAPRRRAG